MPPACRGGALQARWECYYQVEPLEGLSQEGANFVLGGEACQWGEGINEHNFVSTVYGSTAKRSDAMLLLARTKLRSIQNN